MSKSKSVLIIVICILLAGFGTWYAMSSAPSPAKNNSAVSQAGTGTAIGQVLPQITLRDLEGRSVQVEGKGKITVVNFWATWCPPCKAEMPDLNLFAGKHQSDVAFYAINIQEPAGKVADFMTLNHYNRMQVLLDQDGALAKQFHVSAIPTTIVTDKNGVIRYRKSGGMSLTELESIISGL